MANSLPINPHSVYMALEGLDHKIGNKRLGVALDSPKVNYFMSLTPFKFILEQMSILN